MKNNFNDIRNLLFDLDGTLIDSSETIGASIRFALGRVGESADSGPPVETLIGMSLLDIFLNCFGMGKERAEVAISQYREHFERQAQKGTRIYPDIRAVLSRLQEAEYRLFIATVKPTAIAESVLGDLQLISYFDGVAGSSMTHERRHKTDIIAHALRKHELDPRRSMMVGDRAQDIHGARDNGLLSVGVTYGFGARKELDAAGPDHMVDEALELLELLDAG
mgnify:CR=1 FL=1